MKSLKPSIMALFIISCLIAQVLFAADPSRKTLEDMERVLLKAQNLDEFLNNSALVDEYFHYAQSYYGKESFERVSYDRIISQMRGMIKKVPELKSRLWETLPKEEFNLQSLAQGYGRDLGLSQWKSFLAETEKKVKGNAGSLIKLAEKPEDLDQFLKAVNERMEKEMDELKRSDLYTSATTTAKKNLEAKLIQKLKDSDDVQKVSSWLTHLIFSEEQTQGLLNSGDPNLILDKLYDLKNNPRKYLKNGDHVHGAVISLIKNNLPDPKKLLEDPELFPKKMIKTKKGTLVPDIGSTDNYVFKSIPRRFHGVFKGIKIGECVGGNCQSIDELSEERWAVVAIQNSKIQYAEKNGSFVGFNEIVPGKMNDHIYGNIGVGTPDLKNVMYVSGPDGKKVKSTLYENWLKEIFKRKPEEWSGYVISGGTAINNAGVKEEIFKSPGFNFGKSYKSTLSNPFYLIDPMTSDIIFHSQKEGDLQNLYRGGMILDATVPEAKQLGVVVLSEIAREQLEDTDFVLKILKGDDLGLKEQLVNFYFKNPEEKNIFHPKVKDEVIKYIKEISDDSKQLMSLKIFDLNFRISETTRKTIIEIIEMQLEEAVRKKTSPNEVNLNLLKRILSESDRPENDYWLSYLIQLEKKYPDYLSSFLQVYASTRGVVHSSFQKVIHQWVLKDPASIVHNEKFLASRVFRKAREMGELADANHLSELFLRSDKASFDSKMNYISGAAEFFKGLGYRSRENLRRSFFNISFNWIEEQKDLTDEQFTKVSLWLKDLDIEDRFTLPKNLSKFLLSDSKEQRRIFLELQRTFSKDPLISPFVKIQDTEMLLDRMKKESYKGVISLLIQDQGKKMNIGENLKELFLSMPTENSQELFKALCDALLDTNHVDYRGVNWGHKSVQLILQSLEGTEMLNQIKPSLLEFVKNIKDKELKNGIVHAMNEISFIPTPLERCRSLFSKIFTSKF